MDTQHNDRGEQFDNERIIALKELGNAFRAVHDRLIREGYRYIDGKYVPPENGQ